jgi:hypothetical protein
MEGPESLVLSMAFRMEYVIKGFLPCRFWKKSGINVNLGILTGLPKPFENKCKQKDFYSPFIVFIQLFIFLHQLTKAYATALTFVSINFSNFYQISLLRIKMKKL